MARECQRALRLPKRSLLATTERACTPSGADESFPAGTYATVTQAKKGGPVQATFEIWSEPVLYANSEAGYAALFGADVTPDQRNRQ